MTSIRDERTGYRYYERDEITTLKQIRTYESLGFSLDDAQAMAVATTFSEMEERLDQKLLELKKKEAAIARMRQELERQQRDLDGFKSGRMELRMMPETYFWRRVPNEASAQTEEERERIAGERSEEKRWVEAMPARCALCDALRQRPEPAKSFRLCHPQKHGGDTRPSAQLCRVAA